MRALLTRLSGRTTYRYLGAALAYTGACALLLRGVRDPSDYVGLVLALALLQFFLCFAIPHWRALLLYLIPIALALAYGNTYWEDSDIINGGAMTAYVVAAFLPVATAITAVMVRAAGRNPQCRATTRAA